MRDPYHTSRPDFDAAKDHSDRRHCIHVGFSGNRGARGVQVQKLSRSQGITRAVKRDEVGPPSDWDMLQSCHLQHLGDGIILVFLVGLVQPANHGELFKTIKALRKGVVFLPPAHVRERVKRVAPIPTPILRVTLQSFAHDMLLS